MDYSPLEKLAQQLEKQVTTLKSGQMNASELHGLVNTAREVYERLVILEFQSLEKAKEPATPEPIVTPFKINTESSEEKPTAKEEVSAVEPESAESREEGQEEEEEVKEQPKEVPNIKMAEPVTAVEPEVKQEEQAPAADTLVEEAESKTEAPQPSEEAGSIIEKYEQAPIEDIAKAISLNQKFQFIRVLCSNDANSFDSLLANINSCENEKKALSTFATLIPKPEADDALEVYEKFQELIKRRF